MKKGMAIGLAVVLAAATAAFAQPWQDGNIGNGPCRENGRGPGGNRGRMFDAAKKETLKGEIVSVEQFQRGRGQGAGLSIRTENRTVAVHLGPQWYLEKQDAMKLAAGDTVEVAGVRSFRRGQDVFIAAEVKKGGEVLKLRDEHGYPVWAVWKQDGAARQQ